MKCLIFVTSVFLTTASWAGDGLDFMNDTIYQFEKLRGSLVDDFSRKNRKAVGEEARKIALAMLDLNEIGKLALGAHYDKVSEKERKEFINLFHELMANRVVTSQIPKKKIVSKKIPIQVIKEKTASDKIFAKEAVIVMTHVPHRRVVYNVDFYLYKTENGLKMYDIHIDESSTLLDFRNQFSRIIKKKGIKYLVSKLKRKLKQLKVTPKKK